MYVVQGRSAIACLVARASSHAQSSRNRRPDLHSFCFSHCAQVKWLNKAEVHNSLLTGMQLEEMGLGAMVRRFDHDIDQREALSLSRARSLSRSLARALSNPNAHFASCIQAMAAINSKMKWERVTDARGQVFNPVTHQQSQNPLHQALHKRHEHTSDGNVSVLHAV